MTYKIPITACDGPLEVQAIECGVKGLLITAAPIHVSRGLPRITHVRSGQKLAHGTLDQLKAICKHLLDEGSDWDVDLGSIMDNLPKYNAACETAKEKVGLP